MPTGDRSCAKLICVGQIGAAHGVRGEVRLFSFTAEPEAITRYGPLKTEAGSVVEIETLRPSKDFFVARLAGIRDRDAAERLCNSKLYVPRARLPEPEAADEFYHADLIGLDVVDRAGAQLGTVVAIHNFGAGDLIEMRPTQGDKTEFLPFDEITVPDVDIAGGRLVINPSPLAGEEGEAKPNQGRVTADANGAQALVPTAAGSRRRRSTLPRKGRG